jgi:hypothetical protein
MASNFKQGWAEVGGKRYWFRSGFEVRWAEYLEFLKQAGEIVDWSYEPRKFEFEKIRSGTVFYTPDFLVLYGHEAEDGGMDRTHYWHETKGHLKQKDVTKFKRMEKYYPDEKIILVMQNIPKEVTRKNIEKFRRMENADKYVERVMDGGKVLKQVGL